VLHAVWMLGCACAGLSHIRPCSLLGRGTRRLSLSFVARRGLFTRMHTAEPLITTTHADCVNLRLPYAPIHPIYRHSFHPPVRPLRFRLRLSRIPPLVALSWITLIKHQSGNNLHGYAISPIHKRNIHNSNVQAQTSPSSPTIPTQTRHRNG